MSLDASALSARIAQARVEAGLTQNEVAAMARIDRTALAKIETGARGVSALELAGIAEAVGQRIDWFMSDGPTAVVSHRVRRGSDSVTARIDQELEQASRDVEFLADEHVLTLPSRYAWQAPRTSDDAESMAARARAELGLDADEPALDLPELLAPLGLLLFTSELGTNEADAGTVLLENGGVAVVNSTSHLGRRRISGAHEFAHFLVADDYTVDWRVAEYANGQRLEALFDRFARALLVPARSLSSYWQSVEGSGIHAAAARTANYFRVDMSTLARRLTETGTESDQVADRVRIMRTTQADILEYDLLVPYELEARTLPKSYERAVLALYRTDRVSAERALELLRGKYAADDLPELPATHEDEMWAIVS